MKKNGVNALQIILYNIYIIYMCMFTERMLELLTMSLYMEKDWHEKRPGERKRDELRRIERGRAEQPNLKHDKSSGALDTGGAAAATARRCRRCRCEKG